MWQFTTDITRDNIFVLVLCQLSKQITDIADCNILKRRKQTSIQILYFLPSPVSSGDRKLKTKVRKGLVALHNNNKCHFYSKDNIDSNVAHS